MTKEIEEALKCGTTHYAGCECHELAWRDQVQQLRDENEKLKEERDQWETACAAKDLIIAKMRAALALIAGIDMQFVQTQFDFCDCQESNAYAGMATRRRDTARAVLSDSTVSGDEHQRLMEIVEAAEELAVVIQSALAALGETK